MSENLAHISLFLPILYFLTIIFIIYPLLSRKMASVGHVNGPPGYDEQRGGGSARMVENGGQEASEEVGHSRGCAEIILIIISYILVILFFPFAICYCIRTVQEYERAVIFRLGRLLPGGAKGPGKGYCIPYN